MIIDYEKNEKKISKICRILGVLKELQIEKFHGSGTRRYFSWLDSDRPSFALQFEPYGALGGHWGQKLLRNYEKITTKS